jgi:hypothetical protein
VAEGVRAIARSSTARDLQRGRRSWGSNVIDSPEVHPGGPGP